MRLQLSLPFLQSSLLSPLAEKDQSKNCYPVNCDWNKQDATLGSNLYQDSLKWKIIWQQKCHFLTFAVEQFAWKVRSHQKDKLTFDHG